MAAPSIPAGLPKERVAAYNDLYDMLGPDAAADYASQFGITAPAPAPVAAPAPTATPAPVTLNLQPGPGGRIVNMPVGTTPPPVELPEVRTQLQDRPGIPALRMTQDELTEAAIKTRTIVLQRSGLDYDTARKQAEEAVSAARNAPRTIEFKPKPSKPAGYSELAVRGEEMLPKLSAGEATIEAIKPQVLETESQAEGRRRFEQQQRAAKAEIERLAKSTGRMKKVPDLSVSDPTATKDVPDLDAIIPGLEISNVQRANDILAQQFPDGNVPGGYAKAQQELLAALNAPLYAAVNEYTPGRFSVSEKVSDVAMDALRGLTQEEKQGRLVETRGAAALRNIGGLTRYGIKGLENVIVEPVVKGIVAGLDPSVTYGDLTRLEEEAIESGGGVKRFEGPGVKYEKGFETRNKLETGSYLKDVAYEVATGRSAIDDYYDAGAPVAVATVLGVITEIGLPASPIGYVTDVATPALRLASKIPYAGAPLRAAGRGLNLIGDLPEAVRLNRFIKDQIKNAPDLANALENPGFLKTWSNVADARVNLAIKVADDASDIAAVTKLVRAGDGVKIGVRLADVIEGAVDGTATVNKIAGRLWDDFVGTGTMTESDFIAALRDPKASGFENDILRVSKEVNSANIQKLTSSTTADIARNSYATAVKSVDDFDSPRDAVVRATLAETLEKVPNSKYMFITPRLMVTKELANSKPFQKEIAAAVRALPPDSSIDDVMRQVEKTIKDKFKGTDIAEPAAMTPPTSEGLLPAAPRGGLERIATPAARRMTVLEGLQDIRDTVKALRPSDTKLVSETFAGSTFIGGTQKTLDTALNARIPVQMRDFLIATKSEIEALGVTKTRIVGGKIEGTLIDALRLQGDDALDAYLTARIEADLTDSTTLRASRVTGRVGSKEFSALDAGRSDAIETIVYNFFGDNVNILTEPNVAQIISAAAKNASKNATSAMDAAVDAIAITRANIPELATAGRRGAASFRDDVASAALDYVITQEAKVIFTENFFKNYPELQFNPSQFTNNAKAAMFNNLDDIERVMGGPATRPPGEEEFLKAFRSVDDIDNLSATAIAAQIDELPGAPGLQIPETIALHKAIVEKVFPPGELLFDGMGNSMLVVKVDVDPNGVVLSVLKPSQASGIISDNLVRVLGVPGAGAEFHPANKALMDSYKSEVKSAYQNLQDSNAGFSAKVQKAKDIINAHLRVDINAQQLAKDAVINANKMSVDGSLDFARGTLFSTKGPETTKLLRDLNELGEPLITSAAIRGMDAVIRPHAEAVTSFLMQNKILRPVTEGDIVTFLSKDVYAPIPQSQKKLIESLIGPIDNLRAGKSVIADNLGAIYRNPASGLGVSITQAAKSFMDTVRGLSVPGLTAGVPLPNAKFFSLNYFGAPLVMSLTSPGLAAKTILGELSRVIPIRSWQEANLSFTRQMAKTAPNDIAFVSTAGIPYTYGQLTKFMDENYFGMTQETFAFANKFGEDVRIELGLDHSGTPASGLDKSRDAVLRYMNVAGTNYYTRVASSVDTGWRQQTFLAALKNGETVEGARRVAANAVMDYGRIPADIRTMARRYMTFFSWFAVSNAEVFSSLLRPAAASNIAKGIRAQRDLHRGFGEWTYSGDDLKKRMFSVSVGNYDDLPAYYVGPENPVIGPLIDQVSIASGLAAIATGNLSPARGFEAFSSAIVDKSFTPFLGYLADIGALGETGATGKVVPARQIAFHRAIGDAHFGDWMRDNNITTVTTDERRVGEPTFYGQQYMYADEAARKKAAFMDFALVMAGLGRALNDYSQMGLILAPPPGTELKRFDNTALGVLQYFAAGNLSKGTNEHEAVRNAIISTNVELRKMSED